MRCSTCWPTSNPRPTRPTSSAASWPTWPSAPRSSAGRPPTGAMRAAARARPWRRPAAAATRSAGCCWRMFDTSEHELATLEELADDPDPVVARTALMWLCQVQENSGEVAEATETAQRALALTDDSSGPWLRAMVESQLAGLAIQAGDPRLALECARRALPTMEALGAFEDCVQLRSVIALAELGAGRPGRAPPGRSTRSGPTNGPGDPVLDLRRHRRRRGRARPRRHRPRPAPSTAKASRSPRAGCIPGMAAGRSS